MTELAATLFSFLHFFLLSCYEAQCSGMEDYRADGFGCRPCVFDNSDSFFASKASAYRGRGKPGVRGNVEIAGPDLISWIAGYRTPAAKPGCRRQWMGKMSFSGILGQASFKQMKKGMGDGFLLLL